MVLDDEAGKPFFGCRLLCVKCDNREVDVQIKVEVVGIGVVVVVLVIPPAGAEAKQEPHSQHGKVVFVLGSEDLKMPRVVGQEA